MMVDFDAAEIAFLDDLLKVAVQDFDHGADKTIYPLRWVALREGARTAQRIRAKLGLAP